MGRADYECGGRGRQERGDVMNKSENNGWQQLSGPLNPPPCLDGETLEDAAAVGNDKTSLFTYTMSCYFVGTLATFSWIRPDRVALVMLLEHFTSG